MIPEAEAVYLAYHEKVSAYVRGKVDNYHDAEDLTAQIFEKICGKLDTFDHTKASLSTWVYTVARNAVTDYFRCSHSTVPLEDYMVEDTPAPGLNDEALEVLADALLKLKEKERSLIILHYYRGHTLKTVADMLQMSYINAKVIHKKALSGLRAYYQEN